MALESMKCEKLHIFMFPFLAPGHQIPMLDMAKLLATKPNIKVSLITTSHNVNRFRADISTHLDITLHTLDFPPEAAALLGGSDNLDSVCREISGDFINAVMLLEPMADTLVAEHRPDVIISDIFLPWTDSIATKYEIPRVGFHVSSCFALSVNNSAINVLYGTGVFTPPPSDPFLVPGMPEEVYVSMSHLPSRFFRNLDVTDFFMKVSAAEMNTKGVVFNTFYDLEASFIDYYKRASGKKVWALGPYLLYNKEETEMLNRGQVSNIDKNECITWLDSHKPNSVLFIAFGSLCAFSQAQLLEIAMGLEASNCPFVWALRNADKVSPELMAVEERVKGRGLIIKGWAPQAMILNHPSVGGFLTHCGWNSVVEGVCFGKPMLTWPLFGDHLLIDILVVEKLKVGFRIGADTGMEWGVEEELGVQVKRELVAEGVTRLMGTTEDVMEMRERAKKLSESAKTAVQKGGSSLTSMDDLIDELIMSNKAKRGVA